MSGDTIVGHQEDFLEMTGKAIKSVKWGIDRPPCCPCRTLEFDSVRSEISIKKHNEVN
jgi:hypothetical protein